MDARVFPRVLAPVRVWFAFVLLPLLALMQIAWAWSEFRGEDYEEPAGVTIDTILNPADDIYGVGGGWGLWLVNTPIEGDYFVHLFWNGIEDASYGGFGLTLRLMPHWRWAPFVGAGGSYNWSFTESSDDGVLADTSSSDELTSRGAAYWGGHIETGLRVSLESTPHLVEVLGRYTWSSLEGDRDYWLIGLRTGLWE